jgi:hypothetical protein
VQIDRYDPRRDKEALKELFTDFIQNKSYFNSNWNKFEYELNKRLLNLQYRNSMVIVKDGENLVGWGTYTIFRDYLGNDRAIIHQVITRREDAFKKGIEELVIRELETYIKKTNPDMDKIFIICPDADGSMRSLLMKLGMKKSEYFWYEKPI